MGNPILKALRARVPEHPIDLVAAATAASLASPYRPKDRRGFPGSLLSIEAGPRPIVVGDLHACLDHLEAILAHGDNARDLESGDAFLLLLGDAVHDDRPGRLEETASSIDALDAVFALQAAWPRSFAYLRGNHDSFDPRFSKGGVRQGELLGRAIAERRGASYAAAVERYFASLPLFAEAEGLLAAHAGPPAGGIDRSLAIAAADDPSVAEQLVWNRAQGDRGEGHARGSHRYSRLDVEATRELFGMPNALFVVGHNPLWDMPGEGGAWRDPYGIERHLILYDGYESRAPYLTRDGRGLALRHAVE
jgi:hypothetical protein